MASRPRPLAVMVALLAVLQLFALAAVEAGPGHRSERAAPTRVSEIPGLMPWAAPGSVPAAAPVSVPAPAPPAAPAPAPPAGAAPVAPAERTAEPGHAPAVADDAKGLAAQLAAAEAAVSDPATPPGLLASMAHLQQLAYRKLVTRPEWKPEVVAALPPAFVASVEDNFAAGAKLRSMSKRPKTKLPRWRIVRPAPAEELLEYYKQAQEATGVPWQYLAAIHLVETRMGRVRGTSSAGAQGPMQFMPSTWAAYGKGDVNSNRDAIDAAARYLHRNGAPADMRGALWNYNHDYRYVDAVALYAARMKADERAFYGYHDWQVYYATAGGDVWLPEGYSA